MNKPQLAVPNEIRWIHETRDTSPMEQYRSTVHEVLSAQEDGARQRPSRAHRVILYVPLSGFSLLARSEGPEQWQLTEFDLDLRGG